MAVYLATKTLAAIDAMLEKDGGATYRGWLAKTMPHMSDAYSTNSEPFRTHLGASVIGYDCARHIWYGFRWARKPKFPARILRLFNRGHLEEARFIAMLLAIGVQVYQHDDNGKQYRISDASGHYGGSGDGIGVGIPDVPAGMACLLEFKTHGDSSFKTLLKDGVEKAKPEHYVQMTQYLGKFGLPVALYGAVNKNTDALYLELIGADQSVFERYLDRARKIVWMDTPPDRIAKTPGDYRCKWCDDKMHCFDLGETPDRNCRTCKHSKPIESPDNRGVWFCSKHATELPKAVQFKGCDQYERAF